MFEMQTKKKLVQIMNKLWFCYNMHFEDIYDNMYTMYKEYIMIIPDKYLIKYGFTYDTDLD